MFFDDEKDLTGENTIDPLQTREKASDKKIHIEDGLVLDIPAMPRLCEKLLISIAGLFLAILTAVCWPNIMLKNIQKAVRD